MSLEIGRRLVEVRERRGLSQGEVAAKAGMQPSAVSHFETGRRTPSAANLQRLSDALGVSTDYLLGRIEQSESVGPTAAKLLAYYGKLSSADQGNLLRFAAVLADKADSERA